MEHSGLFNSNNGDRKYKAEDLAILFATFLSNGICPDPSTNLQVIANDDMTVTIKAGMAWIKGHFYYNDSDLILSIKAADGILNRIDRVAVKLVASVRAINIVAKEGPFASTPAALDLQRDADAYELGIADIYITAGATSISQGNITDQRQNSELCGWVNSLITVDSTTLFNQFTQGFTDKELQFQSDFTTWFNTIKDQLGTDAAGNLLNLINAIPKIFDGTSEPSVTKAGDFWFKELT